METLQLLPSIDMSDLQGFLWFTTMELISAKIMRTCEKRNKYWATHQLDDEKSFILVNTDGLFYMVNNDDFTEITIENLKTEKTVPFD